MNRLGPRADGGSSARRSRSERSSRPSSSAAYFSIEPTIGGEPAGMSGSGGGCVAMPCVGGSTWRYQGTSFLLSVSAGPPDACSRVSSRTSATAGSSDFGVEAEEKYRDGGLRMAGRHVAAENCDAANGEAGVHKSRRAEERQGEQPPVAAAAASARLVAIIASGRVGRHDG